MRLCLVYHKIQQNQMLWHSWNNPISLLQKPNWPKALYKLSFAVIFGSPLGGTSSPHWLSNSLEGTGGKKLLFPALFPECLLSLPLHLYFFAFPACLEIAACRGARSIRTPAPVASTRLKLVEAAGDSSGWSCVRACNATLSAIPFCNGLW